MLPRYLTSAVLITAVLYLTHWIFFSTPNQSYRTDPNLSCAQKAAIHAKECPHIKMVATGKGYKECIACGAALSCSCSSSSTYSLGSASKSVNDHTGRVFEDNLYMKSIADDLPHGDLIYPVNVY